MERLSGIGVPTSLFTVGRKTYQLVAELYELVSSVSEVSELAKGPPPSEIWHINFIQGLSDTFSSSSTLGIWDPQLGVWSKELTTTSAGIHPWSEFGGDHAAGEVTMGPGYSIKNHHTLFVLHPRMVKVSLGEPASDVELIIQGWKYEEVMTR